VQQLVREQEKQLEGRISQTVQMWAMGVMLEMLHQEVVLGRHCRHEGRKE